MQTLLPKVCQQGYLTEQPPRITSSLLKTGFAKSASFNNSEKINFNLFVVRSVVNQTRPNQPAVLEYKPYNRVANGKTPNLWAVVRLEQNNPVLSEFSFIQIRVQSSH
jgi:hypothetical protein